MIRIRTLLKRGRTHPVFGPLVVLLLVFVLAMTFLHGAHDGHASVTEAGALCFAIVMLLAPLLGLDTTRLFRVSDAPSPSKRGPPVRRQRGRARAPAGTRWSGQALPLRR